MQSIIMLSIVMEYRYAEYHYAEYRYAEYHCTGPTQVALDHFFLLYGWVAWIF